MTKIINCTPHEIVLVVNGNEVRFPPSGTVPRVSTTSVVVGELLGASITYIRTGDVIGLPAEAEGTYYLVSAMVAQALQGTRQDVLSPDTGAGAVRNAAGQIVGTRGFVKY